MNYLRNELKTAKAGEFQFYYDSAVFSCGAAHTEILMASGGYSRDYAGKKPFQTVLCGKLMPSECSYFSQMINSLSQNSFCLVLGDTTYSECILSYGEVRFSENSFLGDFKLIFKEIGQ